MNQKRLKKMAWYKNWIVWILIVDIFLPMNCKVIIDSKEMGTKEDGDSRVVKAWMPTRKLLESRKGSYKSSTYSSGSRDYGKLIYAIISLVFALIFLLIKCCLRLASEPEEDVVAIITQSPPTQQFSNAGRPGSIPPSLSRSPNRNLETSYRNTFIAIENPNYIPSRSSSNYQEQRDNNPTPLLDMPPDYESVIKTQSKYPTTVTTKATDPEDEVSRQ